MNSLGQVSHNEIEPGVLNSKVPTDSEIRGILAPIFLVLYT